MGPNVSPIWRFHYISVCIFAIFSKMLGLTELKFSGGNGGHPVVVYGMFGEDCSKNLSMGLFL